MLFGLPTSWNFPVKTKDVYSAKESKSVIVQPKQREAFTPLKVVLFFPPT